MLVKVFPIKLKDGTQNKVEAVVQEWVPDPDDRDWVTPPLRHLLGLAQIPFIINLFWSMKKGPIAPINPWNSTSLEWTIPSPPPWDNFAGVHPVVNHGPYEYSVPGAPTDFILQTDPADIVQSAG